MLLDPLEHRAGRFAYGTRAEAVPVKSVTWAALLKIFPSEERTMSSSGRFSYLVPGRIWSKLWT